MLKEDRDGRKFSRSSMVDGVYHLKADQAPYQGWGNRRARAGLVRLDWSQVTGLNAQPGNGRQHMSNHSQSRLAQGYHPLIGRVKLAMSGLGFTFLVTEELSKKESSVKSRARIQVLGGVGRDCGELRALTGKRPLRPITSTEHLQIPIRYGNITAVG